MVITKTILEDVLHKFFRDQAAMVAMVISGFIHQMVNVDVVIRQMLLQIHFRGVRMIYTTPMDPLEKKLNPNILDILKMLVGAH